MDSSIAIVGMACRYPDARSADELWENILAQRRAFRRIPSERLRLEDYLSTDRNAPDSIYSSEAALIEGYEFDRVRFRVSGSTFRSADPAHWLALDVATQAIEDAESATSHGLPHETTGVFLGNTLTGEFSRASVLRLRWPYVRRVVESVLKEENLSREFCDALLKDLEIAYKRPFPPTSEESLAGGLSNTIAGRISNHHNFQGGCYTTDGACASSLLAVANACAALSVGDLDAALAGGVDLSLDPFELVGFAKMGALAPEMMRVYDARSNGFWPGEGCGFVLLMRNEDALAQGRHVYAVIKGWGISSDGQGGITRPEIEGQLLALKRAYRRAGFGVETVSYFEGHGTGTSVGDATELKALSRARREAESKVPAAVIGSVKAIIGHTKAAAGVAGLIKAAKALHYEILPPTTGCENPHPEICGESPALRIIRKGEPWPEDRPLRAGVSAMGFGGINAHLVLENDSPKSQRLLREKERELLSSYQDAELFLLGATSVEELRAQALHLATIAAKLSRAELSDLSAQLAKSLEACHVRAAIVASSPAELAACLDRLKTIINDGGKKIIDARAGVFFGMGSERPRIGLLFPGQGSPPHLDGGIWRRRFEVVEELYALSQLTEGSGAVSTSLAQPAIVTASMASLRVLSAIGMTAVIAIGHSLGELTALHWAGAFGEEALLRIARLRGKAMEKTGGSAGAMASISASRQEVEQLLDLGRIVIAGLNSPLQTVVSGDASEMAIVMERAAGKNLAAIKLPVSHAFHSPLVAAAAPVLAGHLSQEVFSPLQRTVVSTVTGEILTPGEDLRALLCRQITSPVLFTAAVKEAESAGVDLWLEVGPGQALGKQMEQNTETFAVSLDAGGSSLKGLLNAVGVAYVLGEPVNHEALFTGRFTRPFSLYRPQKFFVNPCELAPVSETTARPNSPSEGENVAEGLAAIIPHAQGDSSVLDVITHLVAERAELPTTAVNAESRLLSDLHLNSITVGQLVAEAAQRLGLPRPVSVTDYADATPGEIARALMLQLQTDKAIPTDEEDVLPQGIDSWVRPFSVELVTKPLLHKRRPDAAGEWRVLAPSGYALADSLRRAFDDCKAGYGVVVCLPPEPCERQIPLLLEGAQAALKDKEGARFVLVLHDGGAAALARTLHLESPQTVTCVVNIPQGVPQAVEWVVAEALAAEGFVEAYYDSEGVRREPILRPLSLPDESVEPYLDADDVLLVTGGGKGITAECALALARETGARLALLGRANPESDLELASNLERMTALGVNFKYIQTDVTDAAAVRETVRRVEAEVGRVTAIIHGAARNVPRLINNLDEESFRCTMSVKVQGLRNLLAAIVPEKLRLLITFGSIIARAGLPGEADYGWANAELSCLTQRWQAAHPNCRCLSAEWSVWSSIGMGARLGNIDTLVRQGITPITPDEGIATFRQLLKRSLDSTSVVIMGRFRDMPTLKVERPDLPFTRFIEEPRVYYPNVELVVDIDLSIGTDPYLNDHKVQGERLFPAVMGLEAMAQVAVALTGVQELSTFREVNFNRRVVVPEIGSRKIRIAALVRTDKLIEVALRSEETAFQVDHFRALFSSDQSKTECQQLSKSSFENANIGSQLFIDPERDLYGRILFHEGRFCRLKGYRLLKSTECFAELSSDGTATWFNSYLPGKLCLGDLGARDAAIHAIQSCIPHKTLLPVGVDRISLGGPLGSGQLFAHAKERSQTGETYIYDLKIVGMDGSVHERWDGLRLQAINGTRYREPWPAPLLVPYVERRLRELIPGSPVTIALEERDGVERHARSNSAIGLALGGCVTVRRRADGKPEIPGHRSISTSHTGNLTLAVAGHGRLGCDIEQVTERSASAWRGLLGEQRALLAEIINRNVGEDAATSATRLWAASECLKKAGARFDAPLLFVGSEADGWVLFSSGDFKLATYAAKVRELGTGMVLAVLVEGDDAIL